jgi:hypothetical protein
MKTRKYKIKVINKGWFKKGQTSPNKGKKRTWDSPTEFKKGNFPGNGKPVGSLHLNSVGRYDIKVGHPNIWKRRSHFVWESHNGPIPKGMLIHHIDGNCINDSIENLSLMTRAEHLLEHRNDFESKRLKNLRISSKKRWNK